MTLSDLLTRCYDETGYGTTSAPAAAVTARFTQFLNDGIKRVLSEPGMERLIDSDDPYVFTSVANQARYVLPESVNLAKYLVDTTNTRTIPSIGLGQYRHLESAPTTNTGIPRFWVPLGRIAVSQQPSVADQLWIVSTSVSDGIGITAYLQGTRTGGVVASDIVTLNGSTAVQLPAFTDWTEVTDWHLSAKAVGTVTLLQTSGAGTVLSTIPIGHQRPSLRALYLWPTPAGAYAYRMDGRQPVPTMVNLSDEPPWAAHFHPLLVDYAVWREWQLKNDARMAGALTRYTDWLKRFKFETQWTADEIPVARSKPTGHSRLGGAFPPDTWTIS